MEYTKVEFTDEQRKELIRLMVGLTFVELKTKFDMNTFSQKHNGSYLDIEPNEAMNSGVSFPLSSLRPLLRPATEKA